MTGYWRERIVWIGVRIDHRIANDHTKPDVESRREARHATVAARTIHEPPARKNAGLRWQNRPADEQGIDGSGQTEARTLRER